ncbi:MAG: tryptophan synthase subunit alpha, partial [Acidobacteria bacterium]
MSTASHGSSTRKGPTVPSSISNAFARIRAEKRTGLVTYVTAGDPDLARSADILRALDRAGADVLEVGIPFSEPLADGPVIQRATERALAAGATAAGVLDLVERVRPDVKAPIVLFTYANPVLRMGVDAFGDRARDAGVDGVLVLDLPIEEAGGFRDAMADRDIDMIFLLSPTTTDARMKEAARLGRGFLYGISRLGVTGTRDKVADGAEALASRMRKATSLPIALGFGISSPEHVRQIGRFADAAVVGSGLVGVIAEAGQSPDLIERVESYVRWLKSDGSKEQDPSYVRRPGLAL